MRCVFEKIRTDFATDWLGGRKGKDQTPIPPASIARPTNRREAEAKRLTAKEPEKMSARTLFWPEAGFSYLA